MFGSPASVQEDQLIELLSPPVLHLAMNTIVDLDHVDELPVCQHAAVFICCNELVIICDQVAPIVLRAIVLYGWLLKRYSYLVSFCLVLVVDVLFGIEGLSDVHDHCSQSAAESACY